MEKKEDYMTELIVSIDDATMVPRLRRVIRSLQGVNKVTMPRQKVVRGLAYRKQTARLNELAALPQDWDDDGAFPIDRQVVDNARQLLNALPSSSLSSWVLFPDTNGTLLIKFKSKPASISIGSFEYSYAYTKDGESRRCSHRPFSVSDIAHILTEIDAA